MRLALFTAALLAPAALCAPVSLVARAFKQLSYAQFQISDGVAGDALAQANAVFVTPFAGQDLATVSAADLNTLNVMRGFAETAETAQFDPEIAKASGAAKTALENGKIKNKVLKLVGEVQGLQIKLAQEKAAGKSTTSTQSSITAESKKLSNNIALDTKAKGQASKGVV